MKVKAKLVRAMLVLNLFALALIIPTAARADSATFSINLPNDDLQTDCAKNPTYCAPYGTITLTLVNTNQIQVQINLNPNIVISGGHFDAFAFNVTDGNTAGMAASGLPNGWVCCSSASTQPFGQFEVDLGPQSFGPGAQTSLKFTLSRTAGFTSVFNIVQNSCGGNGCTPFMVHILPGCTGCNTGYAGVTQTPEPSSLALLGSGFLGLGVLVRRYRTGKRRGLAW